MSPLWWPMRWAITWAWVTTTRAATVMEKAASWRPTLGKRILLQINTFDGHTSWLLWLFDTESLYFLKIYFYASFFIFFLLQYYCICCALHMPLKVVHVIKKTYSCSCDDENSVSWINTVSLCWRDCCPLSHSLVAPPLSAPAVPKTLSHWSFVEEECAWKTNRPRRTWSVLRNAATAGLTRGSSVTVANQRSSKSHPAARTLREENFMSSRFLQCLICHPLSLCHTGVW